MHTDVVVAVTNPLAWIGSHPFAYPALEVVHLIGIALLLGNLVAFELRVLGAAPDLPVLALARLSLGLAVAGFGLAALSGLLMFGSQPNDLLTNRVFLIKMGLLAVAGCNAAGFHARGGLQRLDALARGQTLLSLGLWIAIIICGRWIAYA
jgi:hypothetical protein